MAAVTQIRHRHSEGRVFYGRKIDAEILASAACSAELAELTPAPRHRPAEN